MDRAVQQRRQRRRRCGAGRRRILHHLAPGKNREAEGSRFKSAWACGCLTASAAPRPFPATFRRRRLKPWWRAPSPWRTRLPKIPQAGWRKPNCSASHEGDLELYSPDVAALDTEERIGYARRAEEAAMAADPRIKNSEGASFESSEGTRVYANFRGVCGKLPILLLLECLWCRSRNQTAAGCSAISGTRWREASGRSSRRKTWAARRRNASCGAWARARFPPATCR